MTQEDPRSRRRSFGHALRGIGKMLTTQPNARVHLAATAGVLGLSAWLRISLAEWRWVLLAIVLVWVAEAFNTALEELADALRPELDPGIGRAKDIAAGAVLLAALGSGVIGLAVFAPHLLYLWLA
jgi:diacylglycerol kinase (ATP)